MARQFQNTAWNSRPKRVLVLLGVLGTVIGFAFGGVWAVGVAFAKASPPPAPTISSEPANPTNKQTATFAFSSSGATSYLCSLDGAKYAACASGVGYTGLAAGSHTFGVEASSTNGTSAATTYTWTVDLTAPTLTSINRQAGAANPTNATGLPFTVTFSEPVNNVAAADFAVAESGVTGTPTIGTPVASGGAPSATWTVTLNASGDTGTNNGTVGLNLTSKGTIEDAATNPLATSSFTGQTYTFDTTDPTVTSFTLAGSPSTYVGSVSWNVVFSESVTGVTASDFTTVPGVGVSGTAVTGVTGSGTSYTVTASTGTGTGTLGLTISAAGTITDLATNPLTGTPYNGPSYTITPQPYSLFAEDASCSKTGIDVGGGSNTFGAAHSNGAFIVAGSNNTFGTSDAGCTPSVGGKSNSFGRGGASAPSSGPTNLPYPETFNQTTVCGQPGAHSGATFTITSSSSGIYCATGSITFGSSNVTATVTLVAPSIQLNDSSLNLTPAFENLIAYDTSTTLGNTGLALSGGSDDFHDGTLYAPYGAVTVGGSSQNFDAFFEADTITVSGSDSNFTGEGPATYLAVSGNASPPLYPGGTSAIPVTFTNANGNPETVTSFTITLTVPSGCTAGDFTISYGVNPISATNPLNVPANGSVTLPTGAVSEPTIQMANTATSQDSCQGATLTLSYAATDTNGSNTGTATVAKAVAYTIAGSPPGVGYPGAAPIAIPLTITNPNPFPIEVTSIVVTVTNNPNGCTASTNIAVVQSAASTGSPVTVPANATNYPVPAADQPTIQLKETGVNQNECANQIFSLSYSGSAHS